MNTEYKKRYKLQPKHLGIGGFAEVFRALDLDKNIYVAFKRLKKSKSKDQDAIARMKHEIDVQMDLVGSEINANIPVMPIYDYSADYTWYTMPLADSVLVNTPYPTPEVSLYKILIECARGLSIAHKRGYIHRDLTPNNILYLFEKSIWVVADWGLVRRYGYTSTIRTGIGLGTTGFIAPELYFDAHSADKRADIYSLGRITEWCLAPHAGFPIETHWNEFIQLLTHNERNKRPNDMEEIVSILENMASTGVMQAKKFWKLRDIKPNRLKPEILKIDGKEQNLSHWREVLRISLDYIGSRRQDFSKVLNLRDIGARENCFSKQQDDLADPHKVLGTSVYAEQKLSSQEILNILDAVSSLLNLPEDYILIKMRE